MKRLERWLEWREEKRAAKAYWRRHKRSLAAWLASDRYAQIKGCDHKSRRPNPDSMPREGWAPGEICNDCGIGIARRVAPLPNPTHPGGNP